MKWMGGQTGDVIVQSLPLQLTGLVDDTSKDTGVQVAGRASDLKGDCEWAKKVQLVDPPSGIATPTYSRLYRGDRR